MHGTKDIIEEATALPVEDRVYIVDSLLRTLNAPDPDMDTLWVDVAQKRHCELCSGQAKSIPEAEIFSNIRKRFSR